MNYRVDIIVIGDSKVGNTTIKQLAPNKSLKIAFISRNFKNSTTHDFINVEYIKNEVTYVNYKQRLFGCYLKNGDNFFSTHLIIATGLEYEPFLINNKAVPNVFNNIDNIPKYSKELPAIVVGKTNSDILLALKAAKKFKQIYLCTENFEIENATSTSLKKLSETNNILVLPNTSITKVVIEEEKLKAVELTNFSTVTCSAIFIKTEARPETAFIEDGIIETENGYIRTTSNAESTKVPKCFAIGTCTKKSTKKMIQNMINSVLADF